MALGTTAAIMLGVGAAGAGVGTSMLMNKSQKQNSPLPLPQSPSPVASADKADEVIRKKKASMTQSIYTSPLGVQGEAGVIRKTLTGQ